tara:strand:- start:173 stop:982 length:810 start_codon:yes stop_codon:yes gene_type:complete
MVKISIFFRTFFTFLIIILILRFLTKLNSQENTRIPLVLYKTGPLKYDDLSERIHVLFKETLDLNPGFRIEYYDDEKSRNFIKTHFNKEILNAYDRLVPGAYKADFFRYCVLYINGGVYSDLTQRFFLSFYDFIDLQRDDLFLVDDIKFKVHNKEGIQINFMAARPKHPIFLDAIHRIVENVRINYYGISSLDPTGPYLFRSVYEKGNYTAKITMKQIHMKEYGAVVVFKDSNKIVYQNKIEDHDLHILKTKENGYPYLWKSRMIYKKI